jgi:hypothetical protein
MILFPGVLLCFRGIIQTFLLVQIAIGGLRCKSIFVSTSHEVRSFSFVVG